MAVGWLRRRFGVEWIQFVVRSAGGWFPTTYKYLTSHRGLAFHCRSASELRLPDKTDLINAAKMAIPDL